MTNISERALQAPGLMQVLKGWAAPGPRVSRSTRQVASIALNAHSAGANIALSVSRREGRRAATLPKDVRRRPTGSVAHGRKPQKFLYAAHASIAPKNPPADFRQAIATNSGGTYEA